MTGVIVCFRVSNHGFDPVGDQIRRMVDVENVSDVLQFRPDERLLCLVHGRKQSQWTTHDKEVLYAEWNHALSQYIIRDYCSETMRYD